jgi:hypothetical protein
MARPLHSCIERLHFSMRFSVAFVLMNGVAGCGSLAWWAASCGPRIDRSTAGQAGGAGGADAGANEGGVSDPQCPAEPPVAGAPCIYGSPSCSYGDSPKFYCRQAFRCEYTGWLEEWEPCSDDSNSVGCPAKSPVDESTCESDGDICVYDGGTLCECDRYVDCEWCDEASLCGPPYVWKCTGLQPGCPEWPANKGTVCPVNGQVCFYGHACGRGLAATCVEGLWSWNRDIACQQ